MLEGYPADPADVADDAYELVGCRLPDRQDVLDAHSDEGVVAAGLPVTYPADGDGARVPRDVCQSVGQQAHDDGLDGMDCRSVATLDGRGREAAWWPQGRAATPAGAGRRAPYGQWRDSGVTDTAGLLVAPDTAPPAS